MHDQSEQILIQKVMAGDTQSFAVLVNRHKDTALALAYNILLNQEDAEEIVQDAFVKAFTALSGFRLESAFATWVCRIVVNLALNKRKLKKQYLVEITEAMDEAVPAEPHRIDIGQLRGEHKKYIQQALRSLPVNERLCLTLYYLNELSVEEIYAMTAISKANIKVLLYRGRKNLYTALQHILKDELTNFLL